MTKVKSTKAFAAVLAAVVLMSVLTGCSLFDGLFGGKRNVEQLINDFESACRKLDAEAMLDCIEPDTAKPIRNIMKLFGVEDTAEIFEDLVALLGLFGDAGESAEELIGSIKIEPKEYDFNEDNDRCSVTAEFSCGGESAVVIIKCVEEDGKWYISDIEE